MNTHFEANVWQTDGQWHVVLYEIERYVCRDVVGTWHPWRAGDVTPKGFVSRQDAILWAKAKKIEILRVRNGNTPVEVVQI